MCRLVLCGALFASALTLAACGGGESDDPAPAQSAVAASARPSGNGACGLMMQGEVDELFGTGVGAGVDEVLDGDVRICSWPSGAEPSLLLQISAGTSDIRSAVDLGDGYEVVDVAEMSGPAAAAIERSDGPATVIVFAITAGEQTVTVSPIGLGIDMDSPKFAALKATIVRVSERLSPEI